MRKFWKLAKRVMTMLRIQKYSEKEQKLWQIDLKAKWPHYLIADSKLSDSETIEEGLGSIPFIIRIPSTLQLENTTIASALQKPFKEWTLLDEKHHFQSFDVMHNNVQQRWIVVHSKKRQYKAEKSVSAMCEKEREKIACRRFFVRMRCSESAKALF